VIYSFEPASRPLPFQPYTRRRSMEFKEMLLLTCNNKTPQIGRNSLTYLSGIQTIRLHARFKSTNQRLNYRGLHVQE